MSLEYLDQNPIPEAEPSTGNPPMIVVHMSQSELQELDRLQGGESIDPSTGFREYSQLIDVFNVPEIRKIFDELAAEMKLSGGVDQNVKSVASDLPSKLPPYAPSPSDFEPEVLETESHGVDGDNELAYLPLEIADYFDSLRGGTDYNADGLRQYGFFKELIRVGATIAGGVIGFSVGGPGGAAAGAGLGAAAGNYATGAGGEKSLKRGVGVGAATYGGMSLAGMAGLGGAGGAAGAGTGLGGAAEGTSGTAGTSSTGGFLSKGLSSGILPMLGGAGMMFMGQRQAEQERKEMERRQREELDSLRKYYGIQSKGPRVKSGLNQLNTELPSAWDQMSGREHMYMKSTPLEYEYAKGGSVGGKLEPGEEYIKESKLIKGPGKGQDDLKKTTMTEGSYIIDASTTSMFGDGSSEAGGKILKRVSDIVLKNSHKVKKIEPSKGEVKALLSNEEFNFSTPVVSILGGGKNKDGAGILKHIVEKVRKDKTKNKSGLPPKAKPFYTYLPKNHFLYNELKKVGTHA